MKSQTVSLNTDPEALIAEEAAARFLGVSARFMQKHRCQGDGPPVVRLSSRCVRYRRRDLIDWAEARRTTSSTAA